MSRFSRTVIRGKEPPALRRVADTEPRDVAPLPRREIVLPNSRTSPLRGEISPLMVRSVVVLPAPLLPMSATISPWRTSRRDLAQRVDASVEHVDLAKLDDLVGAGSASGHGDRLPPLSLMQTASRSLAPVPRYASMTRGFWRTSAGLPSAIFSP